MDQQKIGAFLKVLRKQKGLTQEQIAEKFNVSSRTVSRWENGNNMPDLDVLIEISDFYEVDCNLRRAAATGAFASGHSAEHNGHPY